MKKNKYLITKYNEVNVRNGPGLNNLILFKIFKKSYPLQVVEEFEGWYRVVDFDNRKGWVSKTQLSKRSAAIVIKSSEKIFKFPNSNSKVIAIVKKDYVFKIEKCRKKWCKMSNEIISGWILKKSLWGVN